MPMYPANVGPGLFVPTTQLIDIIFDDESIPQNMKQVVIRIDQAFNDYAQAINLKDTGMYNLQEFVTGQVFFPNPALSSSTAQSPVLRQVFRSVVNFGALPNTATKSVAHGLTVTTQTTWVCLYATATDPIALTGLDINYSDAAGNIITLTVDAVNVNIETNFNATAYTRCMVVLEFLKQ